LEAPGARARLICGTRRGGDIGSVRITRHIDAMERIPSMTKRAFAGGAVGLALILGLAGCTNPYDPAQRAVGGGLLGAGTGAAIGAAAAGGHGAALGAAIGGAAGLLGGIATTPPPPYYPPQAYYPPPPGYYGGYGAPPPGAYAPPPAPPPN